MITLDNLSRRIYDILTSEQYNQVLVVIMVLAGVLILTGVGLRSPWPPDGPRYVEVAREMVDSGQWLIPMRGGEPYPDKPPVFMWSIALFYWLTGSLKFSFLLPSALCSLLSVYLVFDIARRIWNVPVARNAALLLLLAPQFIIQSKVAQIDAMVACWITVGCYGLLRHFMDGPAWGWYFTAWAFMGLGIITKGVGFLPILLFPPLFWLAWRDRKQFHGLLTLRCLWGPLIMISVAALWLVPMVIYVDFQGSEQFLQYRDNILFKQTGERYTNSWGHIQPWHYFIGNVIPSLWFPLPFLLLAGLGRFRRAFQRDPGVFLLITWVILVIVFFSVSPGKRGVYILPALPLFAIALSATMTGSRPARWFGPFITGVHVVLGVALITVGILAWFDYPKLVDKVTDYSRNLDLLHAAGTFLFVVGLSWFVTLALLWRRDALIRLFIALSVTWMLYSTWGYTLLEPLRTPRNILANVEKAVADDPQAELGLIDFKEQYILFSRLDVTHFSYFTPTREQARNAWRWMQKSDHRYILVERGLELECFNMDGGQHMGVAHRDVWLLLSRAQANANCPRPEKTQQFFTPFPAQWLFDKQRPPSHQSRPANE